MGRRTVRRGTALACLALAAGLAAVPAEAIPTSVHALTGTGVEFELHSTLTVDALATTGVDPEVPRATGRLVLVPAADPAGAVEIDVDCLYVSDFVEPHGSGHLAVGSGTGSDGVRYYFSTQHDGDPASMGSAHLSTTADMRFGCGIPTSGRWFNGSFRATPWPFLMPEQP